jgi:hypothetical protein
VKISFSLFSEQDAAEAVGMLLAIQDAFRLISGDLVAERPAREATPDSAPTTPKRGRPKKTVEQPGADTAPTSNGYVTTAGGDVLNGHAPEPEPEQLPLFQNEGIEAAREKLRTLAQERGVTWLRPQLEARGVTRLSELSDDQVREFLHDQA